MTEDQERQIKSLLQQTRFSLVANAFKPNLNLNAEISDAEAEGIIGRIKELMGSR